MFLERGGFAVLGTKGEPGWVQGHLLFFLCRIGTAGPLRVLGILETRSEFRGSDSSQSPALHFLLLVSSSSNVVQKDSLENGAPKDLCGCFRSTLIPQSMIPRRSRRTQQT